MDDYLAINQKWWDESAHLHVDSDLYAIDGLVAGVSALRPFEVEELGDPSGLNMLHLQCHIGTDTISWAREGATVTGYDLSGESIAIADDLAKRCGVAATWVQGDLYDAPTKLAGKQFDVVYTGIGALCWLPDLRRWADVVASLLKPGGRLYLVEIHPLLSMLAEEAIALDPAWPYFHDPKGLVLDIGGDYAGGGADRKETMTVEWAHDLGEIMTVILDAGLRLDLFHEHEGLSYERWPILEQVGSQKRWQVPEGQPKIPMEFSLIATKVG